MFRLSSLLNLARAARPRGNRYALRRVLVSGALLLGALPLPAQRFSALKGNVLTDSTEQPIRGAEVSIAQLRLNVFTDSAGRFRITGIAPGRQLVSVKRLGFSPVTTVLDFRAGDTIDTDFLLVKTITALGAVKVQGKKPGIGLAEFERHRAAGFGRFITSDELERQSNRQMAEIMSTIPGPSIVRSNVTSTAWVAGGRGITASGALYEITAFDRSRGAPSDKCWAAVYLNGSPVFQGLPGEQLFDINSLAPSTIAGIEFYNGAAAMPPEYNLGRTTCGAVVIWLK